jgi:hypothetical protein
VAGERARIAVAAAGVVLTMAVATVVATAFWPHQAAESAPATGPSTSAASWQELTGKAIGEALGLEPLRASESAGCDGIAFVEYVDGRGFCYDPAKLGIEGQLEARLLSWQIRGIPRSPALIEYVQLENELNDLVNAISRGDGDAADASRIVEVLAPRISELGHQIGID